MEVKITSAVSLNVKYGNNEHDFLIKFNCEKNFFSTNKFACNQREAFLNDKFS